MELKVEDEGIGLPESAIDKIFDRFYQVRMDPARKIGGTGLGLYITKELVLLHKGKITVASTLGEGTVFTLDCRRFRQRPKKGKTNDGKNDDFDS